MPARYRLAIASPERACRLALHERARAAHRQPLSFSMASPPASLAPHPIIGIDSMIGAIIGAGRHARAGARSTALAISLFSGFSRSGRDSA